MIDLEEFVRTHERALFNFALQVTRDADEAEDLMQETWIKCMVHQQTLEVMTMPKQRSWLFTVLKNRWLDICRHRKLEQVTSMRQEPAYQAATPVYHLEPHLDRLPALEKEIVRQRFWQGLNSREISEELGIPEGTVRWRLKSAMDKLRLYIEQSEKEEQCLL